MDAHHLEFPEASFDFVYGGGILHHIDFETGLKEVRRMMKPDAIALFMEPLDNNPVGQIVRRLTPSARTPDETPLRHEHLALVKKYFDAKFYFEQMTSVPLGIASSLLFKEQDNSLTRLGMNLDEALLRNFSGIGPYFRFLTMILQKPKA
jgi:SAM-dependent methyltransferase